MAASEKKYHFLALSPLLALWRVLLAGEAVSFPYSVGFATAASANAARCNFASQIKQTPPPSSWRALRLYMPTCEVCENDYDKAFEVVVGGEHHTFDSFECAIHALAPVCADCECRIVGHGVEADGQIFCCVNCARKAGKTQLKDRV
jgi:hypothetical protein